jgi:hypothetical protein
MRSLVKLVTFTTFRLKANIAMDQTAIRAPKITAGTRYSFIYAVYLHATAAALRTLVSYVNSHHKGFDKDLEIPTPSLGYGRVKVSMCLPAGYNDTAKEENPLPLVLVLEGGGFVLGQPKDGRKNDRLIAEEVRRSIPYKNLQSLSKSVMSFS